MEEVKKKQVFKKNIVYNTFISAQTGFPNGGPIPQFQFNAQGFPQLNQNFPQFPNGFGPNFPNFQYNGFNPFMNPNGFNQVGQPGSNNQIAPNNQQASNNQIVPNNQVAPNNQVNNNNINQNQQVVRPAVTPNPSSITTTPSSKTNNIDALIGEVFSSDSSTKNPDGLDYDFEVRRNKN